MRHTQSRLAVASATSRRVLDRLKVKLLRDARIMHKAGDVVDVTPAECFFLTSVGSAEELKEEKVAEKAIVPDVEVAEKAVKAPKATTTAKKAPVKKATTKRGK